MKPIYFVMFFMLVFSCKKEIKIVSKFDENLEFTGPEIPEIAFESDEKSETWMSQLAEKTGIEKRATAEIHFKRGAEKIAISRNCGWFEVQKSTEKNGKTDLLEMDNSGLQYFIDGKEQEMKASEMLTQMKALKNELFLVEFPFNLKSQTVQKKFVAEEKFEDKTFNIIEFAYVEDQVIKPYLVQGMMWVDKSNVLPEFLAVDFDGHTEFLKIINFQEKEGIYFFDYEIFQADITVDDSYKWMTMFQNEELTKTGRVIFENIEVVPGSSSCD